MEAFQQSILSKKRVLAGVDNPKGGDRQPKICRINEPFSSTYHLGTDRHRAPDVLTWDRSFRGEQIEDTWNSKASTLTVVFKVREYHFPFLRLPGEIRNAIYEMVLVHSSQRNAVEIRGGRNTVQKPNTNVWRLESKMKRFGALIKVNRQIHEEAAPYLYQNYFAFDHLLGLRTFLSEIGPCTAHVQHLIIRQANGAWTPNTTKVASLLLKMAQKLKSFRVSFEKCRNANKIMLWLHEGHACGITVIENVSQILGREKGKVTGLQGLSFGPWNEDSVASMERRDAIMRNRIQYLLRLSQDERLVYKHNRSGDYPFWPGEKSEDESSEDEDSGDKDEDED